MGFLCFHYREAVFWEAVVWRCSVEKVFLEISQNSSKKEALTQVFSCELCEISKVTFFTEHIRWLPLLLMIYHNDMVW